MAHIDDDKCKKYKVHKGRLKKLIRLLEEADDIAGDLNVVIFMGGGTIHFDKDLYETSSGGIDSEKIVGDAAVSHFEGGDY